MFQVCPKDCVLAQWSNWSACKWELDGNQKAYSKSRTRTITEREVANGVSCDMFSLEETDACPISWDVVFQKCPLNESNTFVIDTGCYMFVDQKKNFNDSKKHCLSKQGRLFEPRSVRTAKLVLDKGLEVNTYRSDNSTKFDEWWIGMITRNGM